MNDHDASEEAVLFYRGLHLFNQGQWFEAHEEWEELWNLAQGERKRFYQGLIQLAVTLEHMKRGNPRGVVTVYERACQKLAGFPGSYRGINLDKLRNRIGAMVQQVHRMPPEAFEPRKGRGLALPVDLNDAPQIELEYDPFQENQARSV